MSLSIISNMGQARNLKLKINQNCLFFNLKQLLKNSILYGFFGRLCLIFLNNHQTTLRYMLYELLCCIFILIKFSLKTLWALFMDEVQLSQATGPLKGSLLFTAAFLEILGTYFINLRRMKNWVNLEATQWFWTWDPWIGNPVP